LLVVPTLATPRDAISAAARLVARAPGPADAIPVAMLPLLSRSPAGRAFLALPAARALAVGHPAEQCPALVAAGGAETQAAMTAALSGCADSLSASPGCGCRLLAVNATLLGPQADFAYAPGIPVRVFRAGRLDPLPLVAVEEAGATLMLAGSRPVWRLAGESLQPLDAAGLPDGPAVTVTRRPLGLDRGRIRERVTAPGLSLLLGF
jgi:hypothetical protein